jgi:hypothetical protein
VRFRRRVVASAAALGIAAAAPVVAPAAQPAAPASIGSKSCGWRTHAIIRGQEVPRAGSVLRRRRDKRQYVRYGFRCIGGRSYVFRPTG